MTLTLNKAIEKYRNEKGAIIKKREKSIEEAKTRVRNIIDDFIIENLQDLVDGGMINTGGLNITKLISDQIPEVINEYKDFKISYYWITGFTITLSEKALALKDHIIK